MQWGGRAKKHETRGKMTKYLVNLRVALFQLNPQVGQLEQNIERTWNLINSFKSKLDQVPKVSYPQFIVFPEFALTGYSFHSKEQIKPYVSKVEDSPSFKFAQSVSKLFNCYTVIGYPEEDHPTDQIEPVFYNSALTTDPNGDLTFNYRKSFLYDTEYEWGCQENPKSFQKFKLKFHKCAIPKTNNSDDPCSNKQNMTPIDIELNTCIGICMDLNPYKFEAPFNDFEFSTFNLDNNIDLIICPMAWLHSNSITKYDHHDPYTIKQKLDSLQKSLNDLQLPESGSQGDFQINLNNGTPTERISRDSPILLDSSYNQLDKPDMENVNYWILRFLPFLNVNFRKSLWYKKFNRLVGSTRSYMGMSKDKYWEFEGRNCGLLLCNRCGIEDHGKTIFAGSSGIYKFNGKNKRSDNEYETNIDSLNESVELLGNLGKGLEGVIMRDIQFEVTK